MKSILKFTILGVIAVTAATTNVVGGFLITDRMLKMFKREARAPAPAPTGALSTSGRSTGAIAPGKGDG